MHWVTWLDRTLARFEQALLALLLTAMVLLAATQVVLRNVWNTAIAWADPALQNTTLLVGLLGAAVATSEGRHLSIDALGRLLHGRLRFLLQLLIDLLALVVCGLLARGGWTAFDATFSLWKTNVPVGWAPSQALLGEVAEGLLPSWVTQLMLPCGFALIGLHFLLRLVRDSGSLIRNQPWDEAGESPVTAATSEALRREPPR